MESIRNDPNNYGLGGFVQVEYGFWFTIIGLFISLFGGLLGVGTSISEIIMTKQKAEKIYIKGKNK